MTKFKQTMTMLERALKLPPHGHGWPPLVPSRGPNAWPNVAENLAEHCANVLSPSVAFLAARAVARARGRTFSRTLREHVVAICRLFGPPNRGTTTWPNI